MHAIANVLGWTAIATQALGWGDAVVRNNCSLTVYVWSVGSGISGPNIVSPGGNFVEQFYHDPVSGGISLKVCTSPDGLEKGAPQTIYAYTLDQATGVVWYDLSDVFGDAFYGNDVLLQPANSACQSIEWPDGQSPGGSQTHDCDANGDVTLYLC